MAKTTKNSSSSLPSRNRYSSRKEWEEACWKKIMESGNLLDSLVTSNERRNIVTRAAVTELVNSGKGFRQVARELQISTQTISSVKKIAGENTYKSYRERGKTERKKKEYSRNLSRKKKPYYGRYRRTKYGKVYLHY